MNNSNNSRKIYLTAAASLCAATIALATAFLKINTGFNEGYIHLGDSVVYLTACLIPTPYAIAACITGAVLADILTGAAIWVPFTAIIKTLNCLCFSLMYSLKISKKPYSLLNKSTAFMPIVAAMITVGGYYLAEGILYSFQAATASIPFNIIQAISNAVIYYITATALDKIDFKKRFFTK